MATLVISSMSISAIFTIIMGVLVLAFPGLLRFLIGAYLVIVGFLYLLVSMGF
jgi:hypothetical protein